MSAPAVPPADPRAGYRARKQEIDAAVAGVLDRGTYILGDEVAGFEKEFAAFIGVRHAVGVANGTDALHLALRACGIGPSDEVITISHTAVATVAAVELAGATPVLVDVMPESLTIDPEQVRAALTPKTKAVIPVHLYGFPADLDAIRGLGLKVLEDCAQSHGARLRATRTGAIGELSAFSFYPTKNLGALGDGGAVLTNDAGLAERVRLLREYGWRQRYVSDVPGLNSRLDELQAAILRVQLRHLDEGNARRRALASIYDEGLKGTSLTLPPRSADREQVYHQYVVRHSKRDALRAHLKAEGIGTLIHYPVPVHRQPAYAGRVRTIGELPQTCRAAESVISLPLFPELPEDDARRVVDAIVRWDRLDGTATR